MPAHEHTSFPVLPPPFPSRAPRPHPIPATYACILSRGLLVGGLASRACHEYTPRAPQIGGSGGNQRRTSLTADGEEREACLWVGGWPLRRGAGVGAPVSR